MPTQDGDRIAVVDVRGQDVAILPGATMRYVLETFGVEGLAVLACYALASSLHARMPAVEEIAADTGMSTYLVAMLVSDMTADGVLAEVSGYVPVP